MRRKLFALSTIIFTVAMASCIGGCNCPKTETSHGAEASKHETHHITINTPDEAIAELLAGNKRFMTGNLINTDYKNQIEATKGVQHPHSLILTCMDSRVPPEIIFDQGIGNIFVARVAGNIEDANMIGSMEFATTLKHSKLIVVLGHNHCGAIEGAIANAKLGELTNLLEQIKPTIIGDTIHKAEMVEMTAKSNVNRTIADILAGSEIITEQVKSGEVKIIGAFYNIETGEVTLL